MRSGGGEFDEWIEIYMNGRNLNCKEQHNTIRQEERRKETGRINSLISFILASHILTSHN